LRELGSGATAAASTWASAEMNFGFAFMRSLSNVDRRCCSAFSGPMYGNVGTAGLAGDEMNVVGFRVEGGGA
jgi:hypothetical protein